MTVPPEHLFVYGTLMRGFALRGRAGIEPWLEFVASGRVSGTLYDLGAYPALVPGPGDVSGEAYRMLAAAPLLSRLDRIEDYRPATPTAGQYRREPAEARLGDGRTVTAWLYVYNWSTASATPIPHGDYRRYRML